MSDPLLTAERGGLASMLLDVQRECGELRGALRECQSALAMMVSPNRISGTSIMTAFAAATAAEAKARRILGGAP